MDRSFKFSHSLRYLSRCYQKRLNQELITPGWMYLTEHRTKLSAIAFLIFKWLPVKMICYSVISRTNIHSSNGCMWRHEFTQIEMRFRPSFLLPAAMLRRSFSFSGENDVDLPRRLKRALCVNSWRCAQPLVLYILYAYRWVANFFSRSTRKNYYAICRIVFIL